LLAPAVRDLFRAMADRRLTCGAMAAATGLHRRTFEEWRAGRTPRLRHLSAALHVVGLRVVVVPEAPSDA
jgi:hypothetical protein